jgi:uncharacterized protein (DUF983 family)
MRTALRMLGRGMLKRCARCGSGRLFRSWFTMTERCPRCGLLFEREEGQWVGAMIVNFAVAMAALVAVLGVGLLLTWPDVPWTGLTVVAVVMVVALPVALYPWSKTVWVAIDLLMHRSEKSLEWGVDDQSNAGEGAGEEKGRIIARTDREEN